MSTTLGLSDSHREDEPPSTRQSNALPATGQPSYEYYMVQVPSNFSINANQATGSEIATYVQEWANRLASSGGWEFYRIDTMGVTTNPGCLSSLFGAQQSFTQYSIMTYRRIKQSK